MEYKKPKEQIAFDYRTRISPRPASQGKEQGRRSGSSRAAEQSLSKSHANTRRRVVRMPKEIAQPLHWADRQANKRNVNVELRTRSRFVKRTLAQTGVPASEGQVRLIRPLPRKPLAANIPVRSGRRQFPDSSDRYYGYAKYQTGGRYPAYGYSGSEHFSIEHWRSDYTD